jgi:predicted AlkP superfamily pyrophosphatase or phosphodiesterase
MKNKTKNIIVISFDGLSTLDFDFISSLPNFKELIKSSSYCKNVYSVYPTLTYPAHATIVTGKYPKNHGVIDNTRVQPNKTSPDWYWERKNIKGETIYDVAIDRGWKTAALLWPITAKSRIHYNMPEIFANRPWHNQIMVSLFNGSPLFQLEMNKKFGHLRDGLKEPNLDNFVHASLLETIKTKRPQLTLVHYTDLDSMRHQYGFKSKEAFEALNRHDERLGDIVKVLKHQGIYEETTLIVLGDHSSLDENKAIALNVLFKNKGFIKVKSIQDEKLIYGSLKSFTGTKVVQGIDKALNSVLHNKMGKVLKHKAILKNCDGSAYIYLKDKKYRDNIRKLIENFNEEYKCIEDILTGEQAGKMGADPNCDFMLEAREGYSFSEALEGEIIREVKVDADGKEVNGTKATHGYSPFKKNYTTVFIASGMGIKKGVELKEMNLIDEGPTMAHLLGFELKDSDGRVLYEIID